MLTFSQTERHVLHHTCGFSRQLISYWEKQGYVPSRHLMRVSGLIGRKLEDLVMKENDTRTASNG